MRLRLAAVSALLFACTSAAFATDAIVKKHATLRQDPSTAREPKATLQAGEDVELIEAQPTQGYYHVRTNEGDEGWVYSRNLEILPETPPVPSPAPPSVVVTAQPVPTVGIASSISGSWEKPTPNQTTFHGPDGICGPTGDGGDTITNARKNRTDVPQQYHPVT